MEALARLLSRERVLVELLLFKLVEMRQLLLAGETRFLGWAGEEVERATVSVRDAELERAVIVVELAGQRGLDEPTLGTLIADSPDPWAGILRGHQEALRASAGEVAELLAVTRRLAEAGSRSLAESLGTVTPPTSPYGAGGSTVTASRIQRVL